MIVLTHFLKDFLYISIRMKIVFDTRCTFIQTPSFEFEKAIQNSYAKEFVIGIEFLIVP